MKVLLLFSFLLAQPQPDIPMENRRHIERLDDRIYDMERQLDRLEDGMNRLVDRITNDTSNTEILLYVLMALLGIDKGSYYIRRRNGGGENS